jgi:selenocysteine-specific elongation factor
VRPASKARPDRSVDRVVAERGWVDAGELERLTGVVRPPTVGRWVADPAAVAATTDALRARLDGGLHVAVLDEHERAVLDTFPDVIVEGGTARLQDAADPLADHPAVAALAAGGLAPEPPVGLDRAQLRELARRGVAVERDGLWWHADAVRTAAAIVADLLRARPNGFSVGEFREAAGITRKHAVPLLAELDSRGITRRRDDLRIAGSLLPAD